MSRFGKKLRKLATSSFEGYAHWCPACEEVHQFRVKASTPPTWTFNGDFEAPSFQPSMLIYTTFDDSGMPLPSGQRRTICHYFIRRGAELADRGANLDPNKSYIDYCGDSPHAYRGKIVELPDWPYDLGTYGGIED